MAMYVHIAFLILALTPPLTGIGILLLDSRPPHPRSIVALGSVFILGALALALLGTGSALLDGRSPLPYLLITGLPAATVLRAMQVGLAMDDPYAF